MKAADIDPDETSDQWQVSKEEKIATWYFVMLDKNKNKVIFIKFSESADFFI